METTLILIFAGLAVIFFVLWIAGCSRSDDYSKLANEINGINDTLNHIAYNQSNRGSAQDKESEEDTSRGSLPASEPVTIASIRKALFCNGYWTDDPSPDDPDRVWFKINDTNYCVDATKLPYLSLELGYNQESDDEDLELMKQAALDTSMGMPMVKICVTPKYIVCRIDILANSYHYLRDTLSQQVNILKKGILLFMGRYKALRDEKQHPKRQSTQPSSPPRTTWLGKRFRRRSFSMKER